MKVLHIGKYYPPHMGGIEKHLQQLVCRHSRALDVSVIVANDSVRSESEWQDGARISRVGSLGALASMPITPGLAWAIRRSEADLIHLHTPNPGGALSMLAAGLTQRLVITHHADTLGRKFLRQMADPAVRQVMKRASAIIVTSRRYLESSEELSPYREKCRVIPLGIDEPERASVAVENGRARSGDKIVLALGRLVAYKGFDVLIRAMKSVDAKLLLIGTGVKAAELLELVKKESLENKVTLRGHVEDLGPCFRAASVFVLPSVSRAEAFGMVQLEAMAAGLPVINTDIDSGVPEVSVNGETGLTVAPGDVSGLAEAIQLLMDRHDLREKFGRAARARVHAEFSADLMAERTLSVYRDVMQN